MALIDQGIALHQSGNLKDAESVYRRVLETDSGNFDALHMLGIICAQWQQFDQAEQLIRTALSIDSTIPPCHHNYGTVLAKLNRFEDAIDSYDKALAIAPNYAPVYSDRGNALKELGRFEEALATYDKGLALNPKDAVACYNRGIAFDKLGRFADALASYDRALAINPGYPEAQLNRGILLLLLGDFERGWKGYEWRWKIKKPSSPERNFPQPKWSGEENISGKTILLHTEQGLGDTIQFSRYARMLADKGAKVILEVQKPLISLMSSLAGPTQLVAPGDPLPQFDYHCPLASLPYAFKTRLVTIPSNIPYLFPSSSGVQKWKQRLPQSSGLKVCINWAGNSAFKLDAKRSILLPGILPLVADSSASFLAIQKELRAGDLGILHNTPQINYLGDQIETFDDTAAIISLSDLVISSDTSVVHLAGALGKPVWVLLGLAPDWRWLLDRDDNPWYPTARLFRQTSPGDWKGTIERVTRELQQFGDRIHGQ